MTIIKRIKWQVGIFSNGANLAVNATASVRAMPGSTKSKKSVSVGAEI